MLRLHNATMGGVVETRGGLLNAWLRALVNKAFTPRAVNALKPQAFTAASRGHLLSGRFARYGVAESLDKAFTAGHAFAKRGDVPVHFVAKVDERSAHVRQRPAPAELAVQNQPPPGRWQRR